MRFHRTLALAAALLLPATTAHAQTAPVPLSAVEHIFGASAANAVAGHGRLTAGIAADGDVVVLTWPTPSCCDQLTLVGSNDPGVRSEPRIGVPEPFGIALGIVTTTASGTSVSWLHDATQWTATPGYLDDVSLEPHTVFDHATLGVHVTIDDTVLPSPDVLQRVVHVTVDPTSPVTAVALVTHANLGLTQNVIPRVPLGDSLADSRNDFGALWDATMPGALHFRPADRAPIDDIPSLALPQPLAADFFGPLDALMQMQGDVTSATATLAASLDTTFMPGVYAAVVTDPPADQFQIGREGTEVCDAIGHLVDNIDALPGEGIPIPLPPGTADSLRCPASILPDAVATARGWTRTIASAWDDAQDGTLSGNPVAAYLSDSAQRTPIALDSTGHGDVRVLVAFADTATDVRSAIDTARTLGAVTIAQRDHDAWVQHAGAIALPDSLPTSIAQADRDTILRAARRAVLHIYSGQDDATGAIVASIARQAPYGLDWPRDGSFFDYALDVAGDPSSVERRLAWALPLARTMALSSGDINIIIDPQPPLDPRNGRHEYPESAWEMNYYPNGVMGGPIRFEIDNTALMVWSASVHIGYASEASRMSLANMYWPTIQRSAELLAAWRDPTNGLDALANEDDHTQFTSGLHGGTAVFAALEAASRVARYLGMTDVAARWEHRAGELRDALVAHFYDATQGRFVNPPSADETNPGSSALGETAWLVWPSRLLPYDDPRMGAQVSYDLGQVLAALRGDAGTPGGAYLTKTTLAAAVYIATSGDRTAEPMLEEAVTRLARDVITQDTQVMGEVFVTLRNADGSVSGRENRVSIPHLWEGTLFYLTTMAMSHPERFEVDRTTLPANMTPAPGTVPFVPAMDAGVDASAAHDAASDVGPDAGFHAEGGCSCRASGDMPRDRATMLLGIAIAVASVRRRARRRGRSV